MSRSWVVKLHELQSSSLGGRTERGPSCPTGGPGPDPRTLPSPEEGTHEGGAPAWEGERSRAESNPERGRGSWRWQSLSEGENASVLGPIRV